MATSTLPTRANTTATATSGSGYGSDDDVAGGDPSSTTGLLQERLQAWKHMCGYLENYLKEVAKQEKSKSKEQDKILKTLSSPLREGHHFDTALGGISGLFENLRANTQAQSNLHTETEKNITGQVLPILERLHAEIKNKSKELSGGAGKGSKAVDAARIATQKHIDALGSHTAGFDSAGGKVSANNDPYILQRGIYHRLNIQILEENNNRHDILAVQSSFAQFEAHVLTTVQTALNSFNQFMAGQCDRQKAMFGDIASTASNIPLAFEWVGFTKRNTGTLINPNAPPRTMDGISFPNQNHRATKPLIEGSLERKSRGGIGAITGYKSNYYAVSPAGYLHEFKDNDNFHKDPVPEVSLYLPDTTIGAVDGTKFTIKGKDSSGGKLSQKISLSSEFHFKAHTASDAQAWHSIIAGLSTGTGSLPTSPVESRNITPIATTTSEKEAELQSPAQAGQPSIQTIPEQQQSGVVSYQQNAMAPTAGPGPASVSPISPQSAGVATPASVAPEKHYHSAPGQNQLGEREYVSRQG
jgi:hypothetical protein